MRRAQHWALYLLFCGLVGGCGDPNSDVVASRDAGQTADASAAIGCSGAEDLAIFATDSTLDLDATTRQCVMPLVMAGGGPGSDGFVEGVSECLSQATGLSTGCTACYAQSAECSFKDCGIICLPDPNAAKCRDCRCGRTGSVNCLAELEACTGVPTDYCD